ncbi:MULTISPECIES: restriction endonuclease [unclassified Streptomyces]|uniref:restriction endonuclease n=1 Tax=unclassified Streptomyces TaxID=2593676 RepID=UPI002DDAEC9D|nr:restriction endonuclease [Streptomyces sp. NBC_01800]WSA71704.1 restriction endonuclease [Streptomyces sp. NBC_01800]WTC78472.1 restriction endonuclease [Streptomyces sp. NBC_01653]WTD92389.1 restriction endonuclease [Streptomyces sp. NBC_01637]
MVLRAVHSMRRQFIAAGLLLSAAAWFYEQALIVLMALVSLAVGVSSWWCGRNVASKHVALAETCAHLSEMEIRCRADAPLSREKAQRVRDLARNDRVILAGVGAWDRALLFGIHTRATHVAESLERYAELQYRRAVAREQEESQRTQDQLAQQRAQEHRAAAELARKREQLQLDEMRALQRDRERALQVSRDREAREAHDAWMWKIGRELAAQRRSSATPRTGSTADVGRQLEQRVAELMERDGFTAVHVTGGPRDLGADVIAVSAGGRRVVVQCKNYAHGRVSSPELQRFGGTFRVVHDADVGLVVTTTDFTRAAAEFAEQAGIVIMDGRRLREWIRGTPLALD